MTQKYNKYIDKISGGVYQKDVIDEIMENYYSNYKGLTYWKSIKKNDQHIFQDDLNENNNTKNLLKNLCYIYFSDDILQSIKALMAINYSLDYYTTMYIYKYVKPNTESAKTNNNMKRDWIDYPNEKNIYYDTILANPIYHYQSYVSQTDSFFKVYISKLIPEIVRVISGVVYVKQLIDEETIAKLLIENYFESNKPPKFYRDWRIKIFEFINKYLFFSDVVKKYTNVKKVIDDHYSVYRFNKNIIDFTTIENTLDWQNFVNEHLINKKDYLIKLLDYSVITTLRNHVDGINYMPNSFSLFSLSMMIPANEKRNSGNCFSTTLMEIYLLISLGFDLKDIEVNIEIPKNMNQDDNTYKLTSKVSGINIFSHWSLSINYNNTKWYFRSHAFFFNKQLKQTVALPNYTIFERINLLDKKKIFYSLTYPILDINNYFINAYIIHQFSNVQNVCEDLANYVQQYITQSNF